MRPKTCPVHEDLSRFVLGSLWEGDAQKVARHLDECPECEATVVRLEASSDTLALYLAQQMPEDTFGGEAECGRATAMIEAIGRNSSFATSAPGAPAAHGSADLQSIRDYKLLEEIGQGGMGTVYKAVHTQLEKVVALKVLHASRKQGEQAVERFRREMKAIGQLAHPNIVAAYDAGECEGAHFLVMELIEGVDLSTLVRRVGTLSVADACELICQAAAGLDHAHQHGLVHRDVKPSNLMLCSPLSPGVSKGKVEAVVKILDLGLALLGEHHTDSQELTTSGQMMGTLDYMAPEQGADTHGVDIRADVYSLGATMYKLLCGKVPFSGEQYNTPVKKLMALASKGPPSIGERRPDLPDELTAIVDCMLARDPDNRFSTPAEVVEALAPFSEGSDLVGLLQTAQGHLPTKEGPGESGVRGSQSAAAQATLEGTGTDSTLQPETVAPENQPAASDAAEAVTEILEPARDTKTVSRPETRKLRPGWIVAAAALAGIVLFGVILTLVTNEGTVLVEAPEGLPDDIEVVVSQGGQRVDVISSKNGWQVGLAGGEYDFKLAGDGSDQFRVEDGRVTVSRFGRTIVTITQKPPPPAGTERGEFALDLAADQGHVELPFNWRPDRVPITIEMYVTPQHAEIDKISRRLWHASGIELKQYGRKWALGSFGIAEVGGVDLAEVGKRTHLAGVLTPSQIALYVDGRLAQKKTLPGPLATHAVEMHLGGEEYGGGYQPLVGTIDEVRISNVVRYTEDFTPAERLAPDQHTLALYHCNEGSGDRLVDSSINGNHARVVGAKWVKRSRTIDVAIARKTATVRKTGVPSSSTLAEWTPGPEDDVLRGIVPRPAEFPGIRRWQIETLAPRSRISAVAWSPEGRWIACGTRTGSVRLYDAHTLKLAHLLIGHRHGVTALAWHPDGKRLASAGGEGAVRIWQLDGSSQVLEGHTFMVASVAWSPDGKLLASAGGADQDAVVRLWSADGKPGPVLEGHQAALTAVHWDPSGGWLASVAGDKTVRLWKPDGTAGPVLAHPAAVAFVALNPDGKQLASVTSGDTKIRLWSVDGKAGPELD
ncbi:MAG: protein kinase, partial [Planctomycetes bacterium]|nr:protein kinase [Planctomycetota bacterium]